MSADTSDLTKVDSAIGVEAGDAVKPIGEKKARKSSSAPGVMNLAELEEQGVEIKVAAETQRLGWKVNDPPSKVEDPTALKKMLTEPPVKRIDLKFPLGMEVTARNLKGVTIKDALDAIHKPFKKKADDEIDEPYLKGFEWDKEESWTSLKIHQSKNTTAQPFTSGKKSKKKAGDDE